MALEQAPDSRCCVTCGTGECQVIGQLETLGNDRIARELDGEPTTDIDRKVRVIAFGCTDLLAQALEVQAELDTAS